MKRLRHFVAFSLAGLAIATPAAAVQVNSGKARVDLTLDDSASTSAATPKPAARGATPASSTFIAPAASNDRPLVAAAKTSGAARTPAAKPTKVPEPGTWFILLLGIAGLLVGRRLTPRHAPGEGA